MNEQIKKQIARFENPYDILCRPFFRFIPSWIHPNHLTMVRLIGIPFLVYMLWQGIHLGSLILFVFLALTDMLDGALARGRNQITELGTILDPVADKLLVAAAIIVLLLKVNFSLAIVVIGLDAIVILLGAIIHSVNKKPFSIKANLFGKIKLNLQVLGIGLIFLGLIFNLPWSLTVGQDVLWGSVAFAILSLITGGL